MSTYPPYDRHAIQAGWSFRECQAFNASGQEELEAGAKRNIEIISKVLEPFAAEVENNDLTVAQFSGFIQRTATAAKYNAKNRKHLLDLLKALRVSVLKVTGGK